MPHLPMVTVITPALNCIQDLKTCIASVSLQTYPNFEHLVIDGCSTDGTLEFLAETAKKNPHLRYISAKDKGIYDAMNKGLQLAKGEYIFFLGADDTFFSECVLENVFERRGVQSDFIYGKWMHKGRDRVLGQPVDLHFFVFEGNISHQAVFMRREVFDRIGPFDTRFRLFADWVMNIRCFLDDRISKEYVDEIISIYALTGVSTNNWDPMINDYRMSVVKDRYFGKYIQWKWLRRDIGFRHLERDGNPRKIPLNYRFRRVLSLASRKLRPSAHSGTIITNLFQRPIKPDL